MKVISAVKEYPIILKTKSVGDGLWDLEPDQPITSTKLELEVRQYDDDRLIGTARFTHDCDSYEHGLIYTDACEHAFVEFMREHPEVGCIVRSGGGSEQGMQDYNVLDLDIDVVEDTTFDWLKLVGFEVTEEVY
jgi:hypothetical protein